MDYHPLVAQILELLQQNHNWFETFEHEPVRTSDEAARTRPGYSLDQGAKAIILRVKQPEVKNRFFMLVFLADLRFDKEKIQVLL